MYRLHSLRKAPQVVLPSLRPNTPAVSVRNTSSFSPDVVRLALRLQDHANANPLDPVAQAQFLKVLSQLSPSSVVKRVESHKYATSPQVQGMYLNALARTQHTRSDMPLPINDHVFGTQSIGATTLAAAAATTPATPTPTPARSSALSFFPFSLAAFSNPFSARTNTNPTNPTTTTTSPTMSDGDSARIYLSSGFSASQPLKLYVPEPTTTDEVFTTIRVFLGAFVIMAGMVFLYDTMNGGGFAQRMQTLPDAEFEPVSQPTKRFSDVKGCDEAVEELREVVAYLRNPAEYSRLGGKMPKGLLLTGPPGTGKTLLARAVSGEAGVAFFSVSGSEFDEMFVGVGASRVRQLFQAAKAHAPCIIFIDEMDAVGGKRNPRDSQSSKMTLNQLLVEMDGFEGSEGVLVIGATNLPELLDSALTRPGRFDRMVPVQAPDTRGREQILSLYLSNVLVHKNEMSEMVHVIARGTPGFTGAELENLVNLASLHATSRSASAVGLHDLEHAREKLLMGAERKGYRLTAQSRDVTAHHEAGHALVAALSRDSHPVYKATILPRGRALGMVQQLPEGDEYSTGMGSMLSRLDTLMAGRVAEEILLGHNDYTTGASSDLEHATSLARAMVTQWGLSPRIGPMYLGGEEGQPLGPAMHSLVDREVEALLKAAYNRAKHTLITHRNAHLAIATALLERDTLTGAEILEIIQSTPPTIVDEAPESSKAAPTIPSPAQGKHYHHHPNPVTSKHPSGSPVPSIARTTSE